MHPLFEKADFLNAIGNLYEAFSLYEKRQVLHINTTNEVVVPLDARNSFLN